MVAEPPLPPPPPTDWAVMPFDSMPEVVMVATLLTSTAPPLPALPPAPPMASEAPTPLSASSSVEAAGPLCENWAAVATAAPVLVCWAKPVPV